MKKGLAAIVPLMSIDRINAKPLHRQIYESYPGGISSAGVPPKPRMNPWLGDSPK
jgi:hypothetical protein